MDADLQALMDLDAEEEPQELTRGDSYAREAREAGNDLSDHQRRHYLSMALSISHGHLVPCAATANRP